MRKKPLTRPFEDMVAARAARDPSFKEELFKEAILERLSDDREFARWLLSEASLAIVRHRKKAKREGKKQ